MRCGFPAAAALHAAKVLECGAIATETGRVQCIEHRSCFFLSPGSLSFGFWFGCPGDGSFLSGAGQRERLPGRGAGRPREGAVLGTEPSETCHDAKRRCAHPLREEPPPLLLGPRHCMARCVARGSCASRCHPRLRPTRRRVGHQGSCLQTARGGGGGRRHEAPQDSSNGQAGRRGAQSFTMQDVFPLCAVL